MYIENCYRYNEKLRLAERRLVFDIDELKKAAARALEKPTTEVKSLLKFAEGGFNRLFEITMQDGQSILARLPYSSTFPRRLAVASEVATMDFVRGHGIPTPRILGYSIDENPVGSEYTLMGKLPGRPIGDAWFELSEQQRLQVLSDIVHLEAKLFDINLPASGSIYYTKDLEPGTEIVNIEGTDAGYCMGPYTGLRWWFGTRQQLKLYRGSHVDSVHAMKSHAEKELAWIHQYGSPRHPFCRQYREDLGYEKQDPMVHAKSLQNYLQIAQHLLPDDSELLLPILRHPDLQPNNIFVSEDYRVTGLIDWQHSVVLPTFLAAGIPNCFQNYADDASLSYCPPQRPVDVDSLSEFERGRTLEEYRRRHVRFFYLNFTEGTNERHWCALEGKSDIAKRRIFYHASEPWEGFNTSLQYDFVYLARSWNQDTMGTPCPVSFTKEEAERIDALDDAHPEADDIMNKCRDVIGTGSDGWTPNDRFEAAKRKAAEIREEALASMPNDPAQRDMVERHWPFDDFDEEE